MKEREMKRWKSKMSTPIKFRLENAIKIILEEIGEDPDREGLVETPFRVAKSFREMLRGYSYDESAVKKLLKVFRDGSCQELVVVRNIEFTSYCEHHMLPFQGVAHVGYLPHDKIVGLSKLARLVDVYACRLQVQERLTQQIAGAIQQHLMPRGAICQIEASHLCMSCRGVKKRGASMVTRSLHGEFLTDKDLRESFFSLVNSR